ncbi:LOW QUALITY PROTEIN: hypothetical protein CRUP_007788 [Coryphaenoides rupestris]|nr:LOW QUALITY PROTEIN: hypothetical protein CRUP_007788 [Coryphaenoides rupestris]
MAATRFKELDSSHRSSGHGTEVPSASAASILSMRSLEFHLAISLGNTSSLSDRSSGATGGHTRRTKETAVVVVEEEESGGGGGEIVKEHPPPLACDVSTGAKNKPGREQRQREDLEEVDHCLVSGPRACSVFPGEPSTATASSSASMPLMASFSLSPGEDAPPPSSASSAWLNWAILGQLGLQLQLTDVLHGQAIPLVLPAPGLPKKSREETCGEGSGVEILENKPYEDGPGGAGQYTHKVYHIGMHIPSWFRSILPKAALRVEEESWNAYPYTRTSREETCGEGSGVEILENKPYEDGPGGAGQYTHKVYHIGMHIPSWFRSILPKAALRVEEESWNAYPYTRTR